MFFHLMADDWHPSKQLWILPNPAIPSRPILQTSSRFLQCQQRQGYGTQNINFLFVFEWCRWGWRNKVHWPRHFDIAQKGISARCNETFVFEWNCVTIYSIRAVASVASIASSRARRWYGHQFWMMIRIHQIWGCITRRRRWLRVPSMHQIIGVSTVVFEHSVWH